MSLSDLLEPVRSFGLESYFPSQPRTGGDLRYASPFPDQASPGEAQPGSLLALLRGSGASGDLAAGTQPALPLGGPPSPVFPSALSYDDFSDVLQGSTALANPYDAFSDPVPRWPSQRASGPAGATSETSFAWQPLRAVYDAFSDPVAPAPSAAADPYAPGLDRFPRAPSSDAGFGPGSDQTAPRWNPGNDPSAVTGDWPILSDAGPEPILLGSEYAQADNQKGPVPPGAMRMLRGLTGVKEPSGQWIKPKEWMSDRSVDYQAQITGRPAESYLLNGVKFDGFDGKNLVEAKGRGFMQHLTSAGDDFKAYYNGKIQLLKQASSQVAASEGFPIVWHVAEPETAAAIRQILASEGITGITIINTLPALP